MHKTARQRAILESVTERGACTYQELEKLLGVSTMTVRRDVDELAQQGELIKVLGGIQRPNAPLCFYESPLSARLSVHTREKRLIAQEALQHICPQQTLFLDGSSTCLQLAQALAAETRGLTILTNSVLVYMELTRGRGNTIFLLGGQHDPASFCLIGPQTEQEARQYYVDQMTISTKGLIADEGTFESSVATFRIKQIMAQRCGEVTLLVDHSKFGQRALCKVLEVGQLQRVITDEKAPQADLARLRARAIAVCVARSGTSQDREGQPATAAEIGR